MRQVAGLLLMIGGIIIAAYSGLVAAGFVAISLLGFIGTHGREGGRELLIYVAAGALSVGFGTALYTLGKWLRRKRDA